MAMTNSDYKWEKWNAIATIATAVIAVWAAMIARDSARESANSAKESSGIAQRMLDASNLQATSAAKTLDASNRAYLAFDRMSNYVPLRALPDSEGGGWDVPRDPQGAPAARLPVVQNFGPGPALDAKTTFQVTHINDDPVSVPSEEIRPSPMNIMPNLGASCFQLPSSIQTDKSKTIRSVKGHVSFKCSQLDDKITSSSQQFFIWTYYEHDTPHLYLNIDQPDRLSGYDANVSLGELGDGQPD